MNLGQIDTDMIVLGIWGLIFLIFIVKLFQSIRLVPTKSAYIVERLGKYHMTLDAASTLCCPLSIRSLISMTLKKKP